jgi:hypothetical protein
MAISCSSYLTRASALISWPFGSQLIDLSIPSLDLRFHHRDVFIFLALVIFRALGAHVETPWLRFMRSRIHNADRIIK